MAQQLIWTNYTRYAISPILDKILEFDINIERYIYIFLCREYLELYTLSIKRNLSLLQGEAQ